MVLLRTLHSEGGMGFSWLEGTLMSRFQCTSFTERFLTRPNKPHWHKALGAGIQPFPIRVAFAGGRLRARGVQSCAMRWEGRVLMWPGNVRSLGL